MWPYVVLFPAISALITLVCAGAIAYDAFARPRPDKAAWAIAFTMFAIAAGCEVAGSVAGWTPALARVYYLTGAVLVVAYLAIGELYLLAPGKMRRFAPGATLLVTAASATVVLNANIDRSRLAADGWDAIERGTALTTLAIGVNSIGTLVLVGGSIASAIRFRRLGIQRNRMTGCLLIALGAMTVALGGTATRLGHREYLYIPMAAGAAVIFAGYIQTRRPDAVRQTVTPRATAVEPRGVPVRSNGHHPKPIGDARTDPGVEFLEQRLAEFSADDLSELCRAWSVDRQDGDALTRDQARQAWALRMSLSLSARARFDALPMPVRRQLSELYHEVLVAGTRLA